MKGHRIFLAGRKKVPEENCASCFGFHFEKRRILVAIAAFRGHADSVMDGVQVLQRKYCLSAFNWLLQVQYHRGHAIATALDRALLLEVVMVCSVLLLLVIPKHVHALSILHRKHCGIRYPLLNSLNQVQLFREVRRVGRIAAQSAQPASRWQPRTPRRALVAALGGLSRRDLADNHGRPKSRLGHANDHVAFVLRHKVGEQHNARRPAQHDSSRCCT
mmetsp:Transcript_9167/g.33611  ORF Transcript_9167/g.33611 Transcript_9167/m.33611 type:complete len:218 (-) Transcript_9167:330-983(-)